MTRIAHARRGLVRGLSAAADALLMLALTPGKQANAMSLITPSASPSAKQATEGLTTQVRGHGGGGWHGGGGHRHGGGGWHGVVGTTVAAGTAVASASRVSIIIGISTAAATIRPTMAATTTIRLAASSGPITGRAASAVIKTGTAAGIAGTATTENEQGTRSGALFLDRSRADHDANH